MKPLENILSEIDSSREGMADTMIGMIRIPAVAPESGGNGEARKADYLMEQLTGFDSVERIDIPDTTDPSVMRSNILAVKKGLKPGTVWLICHMDVVPAGDPTLWLSPPFRPILRDGKIYGRGTEDNGQSIISTLFASRPFLGEELNGMSFGLAYVADEETGSKSGIIALLEQGRFGKDDIFIVPDWGVPDGSMIEVAEKSMLWLRFDIEGKTAHASTPDKGINAFKVSTVFLMDLLDNLEKRYSAADDIFLPPKSTFEPTMRPATVENINTIPGKDSFCMDIRLLPRYDPNEVLSTCQALAAWHSEFTGATIKVEEIQKHHAGKISDVNSPGFKALSAAVESVFGKAPREVGVGGGTCANLFRQAGYNAYVWQSGGGTLHAPNEYVELDNIVNDSKVFATLLYRLCVERSDG
jgi:succinyl-diaminopimelate desuccinylase